MDTSDSQESRCLNNRQNHNKGRYHCELANPTRPCESVRISQKSKPFGHELVSGRF